MRTDGKKDRDRQEGRQRERDRERQTERGYLYIETVKLPR